MNVPISMKAAPDWQPLLPLSRQVEAPLPESGDGTQGGAERGKTIKVGGAVMFSATDFPGQLAAVVFLQGCPWRCGYCHNPHLLERPAQGVLSWSDTLATLARRAGLLDAVVFSGGEPTMDPGLAQALREVRALGYRTGLHTGGAYPARLREVLPLLDWVGMDIKTGFDDYERVTRVPGSGGPARESLLALIDSGVDFEVRTTVHPSLHSAQDLLAMAEVWAGLGVERWVLQRFRATGCLDAGLNEVRGRGFPDAGVRERLQGLMPTVVVRG